MQFRHTTTTTTALSLYQTFTRHLSSSSPDLPNLRKIPSKYRPQAVKEAQRVLTDYLHATRTLPFTFAEHISKNSLFSLSDVMAKVEFSPQTFLRSFQRFLRYHPINEFEFLYESIGIKHSEVNGYLPANKFFLSEDSGVFNAACALSGFGFPWKKLGKLYEEEISIFKEDPCELKKKLNGFKEYGFTSVTVIGICLAFPYVLCSNCDMSIEIDALFDDLRRVLVDFDLSSSVEGNVDGWYEVCRKIRLFYNLGCKKGKIGELMAKSKSIFLEHSEEALTRKIEYFCKFSVPKEEVGLFILSKPVIMSVDVDSGFISVLGFLKHFGLKSKELDSISQKHPYVLGRNRLSNLPGLMRSLDLHERFFNEIKNGNHKLLITYPMGSPDEDLDNDFKENLARIQSLRTHVHTLRKLDFLHGIGYGENKLTIKVLTHVHGSSGELQERFNCLLCNGIEFSKLCKMVSQSPKILNQQPEILEKKVKFLCEEIGSSLQYLDLFPAYLCYDLHKRIKPRYRFHMWLAENGLCTKEYSIASMIATSEKTFIARIFVIHPAAPKLWLECFLYKDLP
ncbi:hypothetical protein LguiA_019283 [Lonicera macranthoides]